MRADEGLTVVDGDREQDPRSRRGRHRVRHRPSLERVASSDPLGRAGRPERAGGLELLELGARCARLRSLAFCRSLVVVAQLLGEGGEPLGEVDDARVGDVDVQQCLGQRDVVEVDGVLDRSSSGDRSVAGAFGDGVVWWSRAQPCLPRCVGCGQSSGRLRQQLSVGADQPRRGLVPGVAAAALRAWQSPARWPAAGRRAAAGSSRPARRGPTTVATTGTPSSTSASGPDAGEDGGGAEPGRLEGHQPEALVGRRVEADGGVPEQPVALLGGDVGQGHHALGVAQLDRLEHPAGALGHGDARRAPGPATGSARAAGGRPGWPGRGSCGSSWRRARPGSPGPPSRGRAARPGSVSASSPLRWSVPFSTTKVRSATIGSRSRRRSPATSWEMTTSPSALATDCCDAAPVAHPDLGPVVVGADAVGDQVLQGDQHPVGRLDASSSSGRPPVGWNGRCSTSARWPSGKRSSLVLTTRTLGWPSTRSA